MEIGRISTLKLYSSSNQLFFHYSENCSTAKCVKTVSLSQKSAQLIMVSDLFYGQAFQVQYNTRKVKIHVWKS